MLFETVSLQGKITNLFVVDISFDAQQAGSRKLVYNVLHTPIFEKQKILDSFEKSVFQLSENVRMGEISNEMLLFKATKSSQATIHEHVLILLNLEHIGFLIKRAGWRVTKIYAHYTFEQKMFKKDYIIGKQISRRITLESIF